jgi:hypothetical protein
VDLLNGSPLFSSLLRFAVVNFIPTVVLNPNQRHAIIKYRLVEVLPELTLRTFYRRLRDSRRRDAELFENTAFASKQPRREAFKRWVARVELMAAWLVKRVVRRAGLIDWGLVIETPSIGHAQREQLRVVAPDGVAIGAEPLARKDGETLVVPRGAEAVIRTTPERAILYTRGFPAKFGAAFTYSVEVGFRPRVREFVRPVWIVSLAASLISWAMLARVNAAMCVSNYGLGNGIVTVLLLSASLFSAYVVRHEEHEQRAVMLSWIRAVVGVSAFGNGMGALTVALNITGPWRVAALWTGLIFALLALLMSSVWWLRGSHEKRKVEARMDTSRRVGEARRYGAPPPA